MDTLRKKIRKIQARRQMNLLDREMNEFQESLNDFQASFRRRESVRYRHGHKSRCSDDKLLIEQELRQKMILEDSVCLGAAKMIAVSKTETQIIEASKTLMLSHSRLEGLKKELSSVTKGIHVNGKRSRLAEVSLSDLRIPLAWTQGETTDKHKYVIFCTLSSGAQVFDTGLVLVDPSHPDISFSEAFVFSNMDSNFDLKLDIYCHQLRETNIDSYGTKKWFSIIKETVMQKNSLQSNKKAINFQLLKTKHLTLQDSSDIVESYDLDSSRTSSGSSSSSSLTNSSFCKSLKLFGQICCRLSVAPYCRTEAVRTGLLSLSWLETNKLVQNCFVRLSNWRLEVWQTTSHFRRGEEPWMSIVLGSGSLIRQDGDRFCVENADEAETTGFSKLLLS